MGWKSSLVKPFARAIARRTARDSQRAVEHQEQWMQKLLQRAGTTRFGQDHDFQRLRNHQDYTQAVPIRDYEGLRHYVDQVKEGVEDVLWPGKPVYLAKTSGTTSGIKYIPITKESLPNHFETARNAVFCYAAHADHFDYLDGSLMFFSGSPELETKHGIYVGRLSGIVNHQVPRWLQSNKLPSWDINCISDWETKVEAMVSEALTKDLRLIGGIPPWVQMFYERVLARTSKNSIAEVFPNYSVFVYGGVNYAPYRDLLHRYVGRDLRSVETYPASEGFIAFQDRPGDQGLLLNTNSGIFFEFVPLEEIHNLSPRRLTLGQVETGVHYAIILNTNAGLWAYNIGDTVEFTSLNPYYLRVTGRVKHFISAFGEHVIGKEVEDALRQTMATLPADIIEFTVAPQVDPGSGELPYHEWFIEFGQHFPDLSSFGRLLDENMQAQNIYYRDLITGKILQPLVIRALTPNAFREYMKSVGKLGEQNKVPRLTNDRQIADRLRAFIK